VKVRQTFRRRNLRKSRDAMRPLRPTAPDEVAAFAKTESMPKFLQTLLICDNFTSPGKRRFYLKNVTSRETVAYLLHFVSERDRKELVYRIFQLGTHRQCSNM